MKVDLAQKIALIQQHWSPRICAELNDSYVKLVKLQGEFVWHQHEREDELFLVLHGTLTIRLRDKDLTLAEGELAVIPKGVEHCPFASDEAHCLLVEPKTTINTGDAGGALTAANQWV